MTIQYSYNINNLSGLQADSKRDRGDRINYLIDLAIEKCRLSGLREGNILELQQYYYKTIERNTAYHGAGCKSFHGLPFNLSLILTFSADCQYPIDFFLVNSMGYIVSHLGSFKNIETSVERLDNFNIWDAITIGVNNYMQIKDKLDQALKDNVRSKHFRYFKKQCLATINNL